MKPVLGLRPKGSKSLNQIANLSQEAPLMRTPDSLPPEGGVGEWFRGAGGLRLRLGFWQWKPNSRSALKAPRGTLFISPGRSEPIEKYYELVHDGLERGFCVVVHDWRGQGLSARLLPDRLKCHARSIEEFLDDYKALLDVFEERAPKPWVMIGHSMGGALNLLSLLRGESRFACSLLTAPMLRVKTGKVPLWLIRSRADWKVSQGLGADYVPELFDDPFEHTFENDALTHDARRYENWKEHLFACPHLAVGSPTWGWVNFAIKLGDVILKDKKRLMRGLKLPMTILTPTIETILNPRAVKGLGRKLTKARIVDIHNAKHELFAESDEFRSQALAELDQLLGLVSPVGELTPQPVSWMSALTKAASEPELPIPRLGRMRQRQD